MPIRLVPPIIAILLIAGASAHAAVRDTKAIEAGVDSRDGSHARKSCVAAGGAYVPTHDGPMICRPSRERADEGNPCESNAECTGKCLVGPPLDVPDAAIHHIGTCSGVPQSHYGCFEMWIRPGVQGSYCVDSIRQRPLPRQPPAQQPPPPAATRVEGWYGFGESDNIDREPDLRARCASSFTRIPTTSPAARTFTQLCASIDMRCVEVCDWGGTSRGCDELPDPAYSGAGGDGARIAYCSR